MGLAALFVAYFFWHEFFSYATPPVVQSRSSNFQRKVFIPHSQAPEVDDDQEQLCRQYRPVYNPAIWSNPEVIEFNNCYSYAFRNLDLNALTKPQPGERAGYPPPTHYTCANLFERIRADNPGVIQWTSNDESCPCKHYKAFLAIDNTPPNTDYHFLRQDQDGMWSHKPGSLPVTRLDAKGNLISDPMKADLNFEHFQYNVKCGYLCVPYQGTETPS